MSDLRAEAEKENKLASVKADLEDLKEKMVNVKRADLTNYKSEIKNALETQIVSRYYFDKGKIIQAFQYDKELAAAIAVLNNRTKMLAILKGDGDYKSIGDPLKTLAAKGN